MCAAAGGYHLWVVSNLEEPRPQKLALEGLTEKPHCMAVIEPRHTLSGCVEVSRSPLPHAMQALQSFAVAAPCRLPGSIETIC